MKMSNMVVQTNVLALNSHRNMKNVGATQKQASSRLASGYRINNAADDAAGLAISEKMRAQIRGLDMASKNAQDGQALIMTAEGGLQEITNMIQRVRELTVQAGNDTNTEDDVALIDLEIEQLSEEIAAMAGRTEYNTLEILSGDFEGTFQIGPNQDQTMEISIEFDIPEFDGYGDTGTARDALDGIDEVLMEIAEVRAQLGAYQNRLEYTYRSLDISSENLSDSESRIRNTDMAKEMMKFTQSNVLQQAAVSMLAQANQLPQNLLQLLR
jgi:flagellin